MHKRSRGRDGVLYLSSCGHSRRLLLHRQLNLFFFGDHEMADYVQFAVSRGSLAGVVLVCMALCALGAADPVPVTTSSQASSTRPDALFATESERARHWSKGRVEWTITLQFPLHSVTHYTSRFAGAEEIITNRGN